MGGIAPNKEGEFYYSNYLIFSARTSKRSQGELVSVCLERKNLSWNL